MAQFKKRGKLTLEKLRQRWEKESHKGKRIYRKWPLVSGCAFMGKRR